MANSFDPLNGYTHQLQTNITNNDRNPYLPPQNSVWPRQPSNDNNYPMNLYNGEPMQLGPRKQTSLINSLTKSFSTSLNPFEKDIQQSLPLPNTNQSIQGFTIQPSQSQVHSVEVPIKPYWANAQGSMENRNQYNEGYGTEQDTGANYTEYYEYENQYKKRGVSAKIDRFVQRFPVLEKFYKQPPPSNNKYQQKQQYQDNQTPQFSDSYETIANDKITLNQRYSDKTRMEFIDLQTKEQTQPVDVAIDRRTNKIYLCDVGRCLVEVYDINGALLHTINNAVINKFQPTAIAVAEDGTIIISSYFSHCLHMHSPTEIDGFSFKQYKLGTPGNHIHQFQHPTGITIDQNDGYLYVCDRGNLRIQVFQSDGVCKQIIELFLNGKKKYRLDPLRIAHQKIRNQFVCILGSGDAICFFPKYAEGRTFVDPFYIVDQNGLGLENACGLAVDNEDRIFISDTGHNRIVICSPNGIYITSIGTEGNEQGQLKRPCDLDLTNDGTIVITDPGNKRIQLFGLIRQPTVDENFDDKTNSFINTNVDSTALLL